MEKKERCKDKDRGARRMEKRRERRRESSVTYQHHQWWQDACRCSGTWRREW